MDRNSISSEQKFSKQHAGHSGEKIRPNSDLVEPNRDSKFIQEFDRRLKHDAGGGGTQMVPKFPVMGDKNDEASVKVVAKGCAHLPDGKEKVKGIESRKNDGHGTMFDARPSGNAVLQHPVENFQPEVEGLPKTLEKNSGTLQEGKKDIKEKNDDKRGEKRKDRDKEKMGHGKDKDRDKEKKKEEKAKEQVERKHSNDNKMKEGNRCEPLHPNSLLQHPRESISNAVSEDNLKKRKHLESNGVLKASNNWPNKLPRLSSHSLSENGRKLELSPTSIQSASESRQGAAINPKVDDKERKKNGIIEVPPSSVPLTKTVVGSTPPNKVAEPSVKPPHPDTKCLKQVYKVPQMETWSELDDQHWLFSSSRSELSKPKVESSGIEVIPQVWAEALQIEQADVFALPYVIPY